MTFYTSNSITSFLNPTIKKTINKAKRKCLKCGDDFLSNGVGNRLCPRCKLSIEHKDSGTFREHILGNGFTELHRI